MSKPFSPRYLCGWFLAFVLGLLPLTVAAGAGNGGGDRRVPVSRVLAALRRHDVSLEVRDKQAGGLLTWVEADVYDGEEYPLTVNVVTDGRAKPRRVIYLLATSSLNFRGSFFTPVGEGLAFYLAKHGYLVVGITPREDNVPPPIAGEVDEVDEAVMADWGMAKHREDVQSIIEPIQAAIGLPYDVLGHSFGAMVALDYAAEVSDPDFGSVMLLDVPSLDPGPLSVKMGYAAASLYAYGVLMGAGDYADSSINDLRNLLFAAELDPSDDSYVSRAGLSPLLSETFTLAALLHVSLIYTAYLPGAITPVVGLPQEWPMLPDPYDPSMPPRGNAAGWYSPALSPLDDTFELTKTPVSRLVDMALVLGSGWTPLALARDYTAAIANMESYAIDWSGVTEKVVWINGGLSMANQFQAKTYILEQAHNANVETYVIEDYGHIDVLLGTDAAEDVWRLLLPCSTAGDGDED